MQQIALSLLALSLAACGRLASSPAAVPEPAPKAAPQISGDEKLSAVVHALPEPNRYQVVLTWEANERGMKWWLTRQLGSVTRAFALDAESRGFTDDTATAGQTYDYTLTTESPAEPPLRLSTRVTLPQDREISGPEEVGSIRGVHRLFLRAKAELRPRNGALKIVVDSLYAEAGAKIRALPEGAKAAFSEDGRATPSLFLKARNASGALVFHTDGEHGGPGASGGAGDSGRPGSMGRDSLVLTHPGRDSARSQCEMQAGNGSAGGDGAAGRPGLTGGRGGDVAPVFVRIENAAAFRLQVEGVPGLGGDGGAGGPGGAGGLGGPPGRVFRPCYGEGSVGANGNAGPTGPAGNRGAPGRVTYTCLHLGESLSGDCPLTTPEPSWE